MSEVGRFGLIDYWIEDCIVLLYRHNTKMAYMAQTSELLKSLEEVMAKMDANRELRTMREKVDSHHERMTAKMDEWVADSRAWRKEMKANREATEANPEKMGTNQDEMQPVAVHREVPKEETAVKSFWALKKRRGVRHPAAGRRQKPKKMSRGNGGSQKKKLAASCRRMTPRAGTMCNKEPIKDGRSGGDVGRNWNATIK
jgi:hypothetical protein